MVDATIACARLRGLAAFDRVRFSRTGEAGTSEPRASARRTGSDSAAIAAGTPHRPNTPSPPPATDALVASPI